MNVLIIGSGGREHAIAWSVKQSPKVSKVFCAPGNAGIEQIAECVPIKADDIYSLAHFAETNRIDLAIVGSEVPLVKGIVDVFESKGLKIFGPSEAAARVEGSKMFLKHFLKRHNIPTAKYRVFNQSELEVARRYVMDSTPPYVIKTDGLAAGKGVSICHTNDEAMATLHEYFEEKVFGDAGSNIVIEEFMEGEEASVFAMCDGEKYVLLSPAQDHKRIGVGDTGKNTGGMGAYAPAPVVSEEIIQRVERDIILPTLNGMRKEGYPYKGCLYVGLMMTKDGPKVVEYNCRLGDPETQVVLPLLESDPFDLFYSCATGAVGSYHVKLKQASAVCVVLASQGYPDQYQTGKVIHGLDLFSDGTIVFHAGTKKDQGTFITAGGRVFGVTTIGSNLRNAIDVAYTAVKKISFDGAYYRTDIGLKGLQKG